MDASLYPRGTFFLPIRHRHSPYYDLRIEIAHHVPALSNAFNVTFQSFSNLVPTRRLYDALYRVHETPFRDCIVKPTPEIFRDSDDDIDVTSGRCKSVVDAENLVTSFDLNESQRRAIATAASMVLDESGRVGVPPVYSIPPEMTLIQGAWDVL